MGKSVQEGAQATAAVEEEISPLPRLSQGVEGEGQLYLELSGRVSSGRGKASSLVMEFSKELAELTGATLFPGSLNVILDKQVNLKTCHASVFDNGQRFLWRASSEGEAVWIYRWKGAPLHVVELLSTVKLREQLGLFNGNTITIRIDRVSVGRVPLKSRLVGFLLWGMGRWPLFYHAYGNYRVIRSLRARLKDGQQ